MNGTMNIENIYLVNVFGEKGNLIYFDPSIEDS
jgi:hypothetical protein